MEPTPFHRGGSGEPLVLIHGFSGTWRNWTPVLPALEASHDVLAVGLAGHHACPALPDGAQPGVPALADALERDLDAAGFDSAHVVGNSLGGWLAFELARRGRARSVVALAPAGGWPEKAGPDTWRLRLLFRRQYFMTQRGAPLNHLMRRPRFRRLALRDVCEHGERVPPAEAIALAEGSAGCSVYWDLFEGIVAHGPAQGYGEIDVPAVIAWGTKDRIIPSPRYSDRWRAMVPQARWVELDGLGHVPMYDDPAQVAGVILEATRAATPAVATPSG
jgi:pimeloyl-ACP methyl ester carboxylesterase